VICSFYDVLISCLYLPRTKHEKSEIGDLRTSLDLLHTISHPDSTNLVTQLSSLILLYILMKFSLTTKLENSSCGDLCLYSASRSLVWSRHRLVSKNLYTFRAHQARANHKLVKYLFYNANRSLTAMNNYSKGVSSAFLNMCVVTPLPGMWSSLWCELFTLFKFLVSINSLTLSYLLNLHPILPKHRVFPSSSPSHWLRLTNPTMSKNIKFL